MKFFLQRLLTKLVPSRRRDTWLENSRREVAKPKDPIPLDPNSPWNS